MFCDSIEKNCISISCFLRIDDLHCIHISSFSQIEDFLDRSENFARSVGQAEVKKIYNCINSSSKHLSQFVEGKIDEIKLKELLFGSFPLNVSSIQPTDGQVGFKRQITFNKPEKGNRISAKRAGPSKRARPAKKARHIEGAEEQQRNSQAAFVNLPSVFVPLFVPLNPYASSQTNRMEDHIMPFDSLQSGHRPPHKPQPPIPPVNWSSHFNSPNLLNPLNSLDRFPSDHGSSLRPQSHLGYVSEYHSQWRTPHLSSHSVSHWQPSIAPDPRYMSDFNSQRPISPYIGHGSQLHAQAPFASQMSHELDRRYEEPLHPHQFSSVFGHQQSDQSRLLPGVMDGCGQNRWPGYPNQDVRQQPGPFVPQRQPGGPDYQFPPFPNLW